MTKPTTGKGRGGAGRGQGRKPGIPNKATQERALEAARQNAEAKANGKKLAKEVLEEFMLLFAGMAAAYQPLPPGTPVPPGREPNEAKFITYAKLATDTAADLAPYQSPTFRAIGVMAPNPDQRPGDGAKTIGSSKKLNAAEAARAYRLLMLSPAGAAVDDE